MSEGPRSRVGIRELRQNLSIYVDRVKGGETLEVTEHGRPVARLAPLQPAVTGYERLVEEGLVRRASASWADLGPPLPWSSASRPLSEVLDEMRNEDPR
jgi:prevent-host-death family protein